MSTRGYLSGFSGLLRRWADRIDPANAPRATGFSFTFEPHIGVLFHRGGEGCPLWYLGDDDYGRAHPDQDRPPGA